MAYSIMLDAGHGGQDPGAVYKGRQEKNDNLKLALAVGEILKNKGIDISYTRTGDVYQTPFEKAQLANQAGVDYFISFHRNSSPKENQYNGAEVLIYDKSGIKYQMAENILGALGEVGFREIGVKERPGLVVLRRTRMPALLIETGFINSEEDNKLFDNKFSDIAQGIADAILGSLDEETVQEPLYYRVQTGAFRKKENADRMLYQLLEKGYNLEETEKALNVYGALKRLIKKYDLNAVTVRCFDLLKAVHTTGCLALAILNAEGIPAACEGDQKSLISMVILNALTGESGFMANPSCMDPKKKEIIFAHCTLPIDMPDDYNLTTHFESGVGVAVAGNLESQEMTIFKCDETMKRYYAGRATLLETMHRKDLCRTQMKLYLEDGTEYFAKSPISNHHIICKGDWKEVIDQFFEQM